MAELDENGHEVLDDTPVDIPLRIRRIDPQVEAMRRMIAQQMSAAAAAQGFETFDEADDFDVGDDYDPQSPYELDDNQYDYSFETDPHFQRDLGGAENTAPTNGQGNSQSPGGVQQGGAQAPQSAERTEPNQRQDSGNSNGPPRT